MRDFKGTSSIVAIALFLVLSVLAVVSFDGWFHSYSGEVFTNVESQSSGSNQIKAESIIGNFLYMKSDLNDNLNVLKIIDSNGELICEISENGNNNFLGETELLLRFDNSSYNLTHVKDFSGNVHQVSAQGWELFDCNNEGISETSCMFGATKHFEVKNFTKILNLNDSDSEFTISAWVNQYNNTGWRTILATRQFRFQIVGGIIHIGFLKLPSAYGNIVSSQDIDLNKWHHIVFIKNQDKLYLYLNSQKVGTRIYNPSNINTTYRSSLNLSIGKDRLYPIPGGATDPFLGNIDELVIYSRALNDNEVKSLYDSGKAKYYEHLLPQGSKEIDISECNLIDGENYNIVGFSSVAKFDQLLIKN